jgi:hypothetical protein
VKLSIFVAAIAASGIVWAGSAQADGPEKEHPKHLRAGTYSQPAPVYQGQSAPVRYVPPAPVYGQEQHHGHGKQRAHDRGYAEGYAQGAAAARGYSHDHYRHRHGYIPAAHWVPPHRVWRGSAWVMLPGFYHSAYVQPMPAPVNEINPAYYPAGWMWVAGYWYWSAEGWSWQVGNWVRL